MLEWNESLAVGVEVVDEQHKALFARLDDLFAAVSREDKQEKVSSLLVFLTDYVKSHFETEQRYMASLAYPGLVAHRQQHEQFKREFGLINARFAEKGATGLLPVLAQRRIADWWLNHVRQFDKVMGQYRPK